MGDYIPVSRIFVVWAHKVYTMNIHMYFLDTCITLSCILVRKHN